MMWILVRQELRTLRIGNGHTCASSTGPGPNIPKGHSMSNQHKKILTSSDFDETW